jgi:TolA-binding protein
MKKWIILALFLLAAPSLSLAQQISLRYMAADQMFIYGQAIFDRGDYVEAANVFKRILAILPDHEGAIEYAMELNKKGQHIAIPVVVKAVKPKAKVVAKQEIAKPLIVQAPPVVVLPPSDPNDDLKQSIHKADQTIEKLKTDIIHINTQITQGQKEFQEDKNQIK